MQVPPISSVVHPSSLLASPSTNETPDLFLLLQQLLDLGPDGVEIVQLQEIEEFDPK